MNINKTIIETVSKQLDLSYLKMTAKFDDIGADSLDFVEIIILVEDRFNVDISDGEFDEIKSLNDLGELVRAKC